MLLKLLTLLKSLLNINVKTFSHLHLYFHMYSHSWFHVFSQTTWTTLSLYFRWVRSGIFLKFVYQIDIVMIYCKLNIYTQHPKCLISVRCAACTLWLSLVLPSNHSQAGLHTKMVSILCIVLSRYPSAIVLSVRFSIILTGELWVPSATCFSFILEK